MSKLWWQKDMWMLSVPIRQRQIQVAFSLLSYQNVLEWVESVSIIQYHSNLERLPFLFSSSHFLVYLLYSNKGYYLYRHSYSMFVIFYFMFWQIGGSTRVWMFVKNQNKRQSYTFRTFWWMNVWYDVGRRYKYERAKNDACVIHSFSFIMFIKILFINILL